MKIPISFIFVLSIVFQVFYSVQCAATFPVSDDHFIIRKNSTDTKFSETVRVDEAMKHLNELQNIANEANGTRAADTIGFNRTLDYLTRVLSKSTNFKITKTFFSVRDHNLAENPILISLIDGSTTNHIYSANDFITEFVKVRYSTSVDFTSFIPLTSIPNDGCENTDWTSAADRIVLLRRTEKCTFLEQSLLAEKFKAKALLLYDNKSTPVSIHLGMNNSLPALSISFALAERFARALRNSSTSVGIRMKIVLRNEKSFPVGNICADTLTGDPTRTIIVGSHSDGVRMGPGINDDGSGTAANLALAITLSRLFETSTYEKYNYRVRFCWWAAEEIGILGSKYYVEQAKSSTMIGERIADCVVYINFDMLGSPNFIFGTYDGRTANEGTPSSIVHGSFQISKLFRDWFIQQNLPWDFVEFGYGSDYVPFLNNNVPVGGLYSGSDEIKTKEQRDRYDSLLGQGQGGIANVDLDPCYHEPCDSIENINLFGYEKMIQAGAHIIETLARKSDLKSWLHSNDN